MRVFNETQKFGQGWLRLVLMSLGLLTIIPVVVMVDWQELPTSELIIMVFAVSITLGILGFILFLFRLESRIDEQGVHFGFFPIPGRMNRVSWSEIKEISVRKYSPIGEYGGWGYRITFSRSKGKAYNVTGNIGIQLELHSGKKILIGTQLKQEAESTLSYYKNNENYAVN